VDKEVKAKNQKNLTMIFAISQFHTLTLAYL